MYLYVLNMNESCRFENPSPGRQHSKGSDVSHEAKGYKHLLLNAQGSTVWKLCQLWGISSLWWWRLGFSPTHLCEVTTLNTTVWSPGKFLMMNVWNFVSLHCIGMEDEIWLKCITFCFLVFTDLWSILILQVYSFDFYFTLKLHPVNVHL